jgi:TetR/AcrR family acrAB operon transcriptional repressor
MPRTKEQFAEMRIATKKRIQSVALQLFAQKGYGTTNVQEIADKAGISIGLLYRHYKTKEELFNEMVEFALTGLIRIIERFESDQSPALLMNEFINEIYHDMVSSDDLANLMILISQSYISRSATNENQNDVATVNKKLINATNKLIQRGQKIGKFVSGDSYEMALFFFAMIQGVAELKVKLNNDFVMPSPTILTAFLYRKGESL